MNLKNIRHLVLPGGGHRIFQYFGAIKQLVDQNTINLQSIKTIFGTSAGSILATVLATGHDVDTINQYLLNRPWESLFFKKGAMNGFDFVDIFNRKGIYNKDIFIQFFKPLFDAKDIPLDISLQAFHDQYGGVDLHFFTTELVNFESVDLNYRTHPHLELIDAVYMSAALPLIMCPVFKDGKCYIDGGMINNYSLRACQNFLPVEEMSHVLGIKYKYIDIDVDHCGPVNESWNLFEYVMFIVKRIIRFLDQLYVLNQEIHLVHEIIIYGHGSSIEKINQAISDKEFRQTLINEGKLAAIQFSKGGTDVPTEYKTESSSKSNKGLEER